MKKNIVIALLAFFSVGVCNVVDAQTKKKSKKPKTTKNAAADAARADSIAKAQAAANEPSVPQLTAEEPENPALSAAPIDYAIVNDIKLDTSRPVDGFYKQTSLRGARPFAFPKENKNNIKFYKRLWREIDLTDSVNKIFAVPGETLMQLIMDAVKYGKLIPYSDEGFKQQLTYKKVMKIFTDSAIVPVFDSVTGEQIGSKTVFNDFNADSVTKFEIKEDIYFDKTRGRVITQIIGLAPVRKLKSTTGEVLGEQHPFWLYFAQCRNLFAAKEVIDPQRDIYNISYDDLFIQRNFRTRIVKESNPADLRIKDKYPSDERKQKAEADRIERELNNYKRNLWKY
jgi:gliding motility associated protien GldN